MKYQYFLQEPVFTVESINIQTVSRPEQFRHSFRNGRLKHGFVYIVKGKMCDLFSSGEMKSILLEEGEMIFVPKNTVYTGVYLEDQTEIEIVEFDLAKGSLPEYLSVPTKIELPNAAELIKAFFNPVENHVTNHPYYFLSCLYRLLWQVDENYSTIPKKYKRLQGALSELAERWDQNEPVSYYAGLCDMSEVSFRRLFREYTGFSPIEYRNDIRLNQAKIKLQSGEYNVSEVAAKCGFSNLSFFTRLYKKKFGYTPKKE